jgi:predicted CoA-binding protein
MDIVVEQILSSYDTITVVGASADPAKAAHRVLAVMQHRGIASAEARAIAEGAGLLYMENCCLSIEQRRLGLNAPVDGNVR